MVQSILFDPLVPVWALWALAGMAGAILGLSWWRGLPGWPYRVGAICVVLMALANPALQSEDRQALRDIVILVVDDTASQSIANRPDQTQTAIADFAAQVERLGMDLRQVRVGDADDNAGSLVMTALSRAMADIARARIAGIVILTDGQLHDAEFAPDLPAPLHALLTGQPEDWDRRLVVETAPAFAILDEEITLSLRIEDQGAVPANLGAQSEIMISVNGGPDQRFVVPVNQPLDLPITLRHAGQNVIYLRVPAQNGELTDRNNAAIVQINGVRDRLRVLLVSGEPHPGQRTWRNLLKADAAVDLVHFTILRPPDRPDTVPASELSLIAFPTRQLFLEVTDEFDLIIFDRYQRRGILPMSYIDNIARYVRDGGALLVAAGPDFAGAASLYRSSLAGVLPGQPTARVMDDLYLPRLSDIGTRHPVTAGLPQSDGPDGPVWGRWARQIDVTQRSGHTVMTGADGAPLLILDRVEQGRVALLASDHAWLWDRGFDGGGPQGELLRRLAHWMMGEPDLEEESLRANIDDGRLIVTRQTLSDDAGPVIMTAPDGTEITLPLSQVAPGQFMGQISPDQQGLYRVIDPASGLRRVAVFGPTAPREFENTIASDAMITPIADETGGGVFFLDQGLPDLRRVSVNQRASGRGWMGVTPRGAYATADIRVWPLVPVWVYLLLVAGLIGAAWMREGRRFERAA